MQIKKESYIECSRAIGSSTTRIIFEHVLRNVASPLIVAATQALSSTILFESTLSFLSLGAQQPTPEWGLMISEGRAYFPDKWWCCIFPGIAIVITSLAFNLLGDGLRDALDPRLKD